MAIDVLAAQAWAAAFALALHNAEEVLLNLPAWADAHPQTAAFNWSSGSDAFSIIALVIVVMAIGFALWVQLRPAVWMRLLLRLLAWVMLINAASYMAISLYTGSLMPGVVSAVIILVPVFSLIVRGTGPRAAA